jgi:DNA-binding GntR family transcriptional regulator
MARKHLTLLVEAGLIQKARDHGLIISRFLENKLQEYFQFIDMVSKPRIQHHSGGTDLSGFEPESEAPEASVISKLHYRSETIWLIN